MERMHVLVWYSHLGVGAASEGDLLAELQVARPALVLLHEVVEHGERREQPDMQHATREEKVLGDRAEGGRDLEGWLVRGVGVDKAFGGHTVEVAVPRGTSHGTGESMWCVVHKGERRACQAAPLGDHATWHYGQYGGSARGVWEGRFGRHGRRIPLAQVGVARVEPIHDIVGGGAEARLFFEIEPVRREDVRRVDLGSVRRVGRGERVAQLEGARGGAMSAKVGGGRRRSASVSEVRRASAKVGEGQRRSAKDGTPVAGWLPD